MHPETPINDEHQRRKPRATPTTAPTTFRGHTSELRRGQPRPIVVPSTASPEVDAQPQANNGCSAILINNEPNSASQTSRNPYTGAEVPVAEYQEWSFQGFVKYTWIRNDVTYYLEFKLPSIIEHVHLPIHHKAMCIFSKQGAVSKGSDPSRVVSWKGIGCLGLISVSLDIVRSRRRCRRALL